MQAQSKLPNSLISLRDREHAALLYIRRVDVGVLASISSTLSSLQ